MKREKNLVSRRSVKNRVKVLVQLVLPFDGLEKNSLRKGWDMHTYVVEQSFYE